MNRRDMFLTASAAGLCASALGIQSSALGSGNTPSVGAAPGVGVAPAGAAPPPSPMAMGLPTGAHVPTLQFVYECEVTIAEPQEFGPTLEGTRRVIPITGGTFKGPAMRGQVLSGGADWNLSRSDGAGSVEAAYYLRTDDGVTIRIVNKGIGERGPPGDPSAPEHFYMFTLPVFEAPTGKYDWLNRSVFVATLGGRRDAQNAVLIRVFKVI